ncbi:hypothetical protein [Streptomyces sp. NPDC014685]|uniref:hypothetical protein n=1 Tax=Streptomyces sp. NPDC014685 TaxID=3364881 RepID=UPI0036F8DFF5
MIPVTAMFAGHYKSSECSYFLQQTADAIRVTGEDVTPAQLSRVVGQVMREGGGVSLSLDESLVLEPGMPGSEGLADGIPGFRGPTAMSHMLSS